MSWTDAIDRRTVSDLSGTFSFVVWLFAQSPQIYENYRRGSVDGLSPVFLTQWMLGDATNLIGCILTQQLPFQIAVATYFCCIDVCIMVQFVYYWSKARKERARRIKSRATQRSASFSSPYPTNPYSVLSETSELLAGRTSRHNSYLRSSSKRRNLSHSQQLVHPHRHLAHVSDDPHAPLIPHAAPDKPNDAPSRPRYESSRSRSRRPPLSRQGSGDTVSAMGSGSVANYRALSDAASSVAQLAQEAARRREAMLYHTHGAAEEDYFSHRKPHSHRSKSRASSSPNHSQPPSRTRSRVNSNDPSRQDATGADMAAPMQSIKAVREASSSTSRRTRAGQSMSSRKKPVAANVDFVPSELSPTRECKDADDADMPAVSKSVEEDEETEPESILSEAEPGSRAADAPAEEEALADSIDSLATVSSESSVGSITVEPRGRDMVRMANRIDTAPSSGAATPGGLVNMPRDGTSSPFSGNSSSDGTARHASPHPATRENTDRMALSHHQLGQQGRADEIQDADAEMGPSQQSAQEEKGRKRRTHDSTRESSPAAPLHRSVDALANSVNKGSRKRTMTRSLSTRSHSQRSTAGGIKGITASTASSTKKRGAKSPASLRRSIGMVLLGIMMVTSLPGPATVSAAPLSTVHLLEADPSWRRLVGRISAWLCALLYITSRIPQIWENHIRRSVEGISILLFIAAFSGNLLYTISVLTNPSATGEGARMYLQESLPFLLGSGGTLVFDLIIVAQWLAWRKKAVALN